MRPLKPKIIQFYTLRDAAEKRYSPSAITPASFSSLLSQDIENDMGVELKPSHETLLSNIFLRFADSGFCYDKPDSATERTKCFNRLMSWIIENYEQIDKLATTSTTDYFDKAQDTSTTAISEHPQNTLFSTSPNASADRMSNLSQTRIERNVVDPYRKIQTLKDNPVSWMDVYFEEYKRRFVCNNTEEYL